MSEIVISGLGVRTAIGQGKAAFAHALYEGRDAFGVMQRSGRQHPGSSFLGAEIGDLMPDDRRSASPLRGISWSAQVGLAAVAEAFSEARLDEVPPDRIGLIVGGSNFQQRESELMRARAQDRPVFIRPAYAVSFMDTDLCGACTQQFGIAGPSYTVGGASASGLLAVIQAANAVVLGQVDQCIAVGALMDLSHWECQAFRTLGAMGSDRFAERPGEACRPFDEAHDGFIFGESSGALVLERASSARRRGLDGYAAVAGSAVVMDANRQPNPSLEGEVAALGKALAEAKISAKAIDYFNPHGTGSPAGDVIEAAAIHTAGLASVPINATKSLIGHGLTSAGAVELIATLLQMKAGRLHPTRNLANPIAACNWVTAPIRASIKYALKLSLGFGGINTAMCLRNLH
jgi:malonyl-ACP decarboxylase